MICFPVYLVVMHILLCPLSCFRRDVCLSTWWRFVFCSTSLAEELLGRGFVYLIGTRWDVVFYSYQNGELRWMRSDAGKSYLRNWDWMLVQRRQNKSSQNLYEVQLIVNQFVSCFFFFFYLSFPFIITSRSKVALFNWSHWCVGTAGLNSVTLYNHRTVSDLCAAGHALKLLNKPLLLVKLHVVTQNAKKKTYIYIYIHTHTYSTYVCVCVCVYIHTRTHIYICMYIH